MFYNLAILVYTASIIFDAFTLTNSANEEQSIEGYTCLVLTMFGLFGFYAYCWANVLFLMWVCEARNTKRKKHCLVISTAAILCAFSFLFETKFPLDEAGINYGTIQSYGLGFYLWCAAPVLGLIHSLTLKDDISQNASEST
ncbi:hypothetical protein [Gimesia sp.]|uniref:hypothetical protein n=1 Tax=Gimesia sp. TaxID=2024833 RepID=UPI000C4628AC|nr:hypothetical protein [Gimesia sp.]MAX40059.1 hypothetical protein [Gimesia sp.]HBL42719.1 hypothetical protein [Planctomycetaceae bacterium]|tara:strand:- start:731 stop:1156 length:426 start_codon:yes stop_codon:yes gene_type:complete